MGKQVLVLTGSPRKNGNSDMMADAFIAGAKAAGHSVDRVETAHIKVDGCRACDNCWSQGEACIYQDDFNTKLAPLYEKADVLVFAMPLYFYGFPAQIKAALDKMYAYAVPAGAGKLHISESAFLMCGGDEPMESYGGAIESYRQAAKFCGWEDRGMVIATGLLDKGAIEGSESLTKAEELGRSI